MLRITFACNWSALRGAGGVFNCFNFFILCLMSAYAIIFSFEDFCDFNGVSELLLSSLSFFFVTLRGLWIFEILWENGNAFGTLSIDPLIALRTFIGDILDYFSALLDPFACGKKLVSLDFFIWPSFRTSFTSSSLVLTVLEILPSLATLPAEESLFESRFWR